MHRSRDDVARPTTPRSVGARDVAGVRLSGVSARRTFTADWRESVRAKQTCVGRIFPSGASRSRSRGAAGLLRAGVYGGRRKHRSPRWATQHCARLRAEPRGIAISTRRAARDQATRPGKCLDFCRCAPPLARTPRASGFGPVEGVEMPQRALGRPCPKLAAPSASRAPHRGYRRQTVGRSPHEAWRRTTGATSSATTAWRQLLRAS